MAPLQLRLDALPQDLWNPGAGGMAWCPAALRAPAAELIEEPAGAAALEEPHDRDAGAALDLGMDGDAPADAATPGGPSARDQRLGNGGAWGPEWWLTLLGHLGYLTAVSQA